MATPCRCRKPEPGPIIQLAEKWRIDLANSVMIGDRNSDVEGQRAGMHSYLFDKTDLDHLAKQVLASHFPEQWRLATNIPSATTLRLPASLATGVMMWPLSEAA